VLLKAVEQLDYGDVLAAPVLGPGPDPFLPSGQVVGPTVLQALEQAGVSRVYVEDPRADDVEISDVLSPETAAACRAAVTRALGGTPRVSDLRDAARRLVQDVRRGAPPLLAAVSIHHLAAYPAVHAVDSAKTAVLLGRELNYTDQQLQNLAAGMLVHDIGNQRVPQGLLEASRELSEVERRETQVHARAGFEMLRQVLSATPLGRSLALYHHERLDGSGYPRGVKGDEIPEFGRIAAIADVYAALTLDRHHRPALAPDRAFAHLLARQGKFDARIAALLARNVAIYPPGMPVELDSGEIAVVARVAPGNTLHPVVRLWTTPGGLPFQSPQDLDLNLHHDIRIVRSKLI